jgi:hypothetical protein
MSEFVGRYSHYAPLIAPMNQSRVLLAVFVCGLLGCGLVIYYFGFPLDLRPEKAPREESTFYPPADFVMEPIRKPLLEPAAEVTLPDEQLVIGIVENGDAHAYVLDALGHDPARHVVYDEVGELSIAVTHCDRTGLTRVFATQEGSEPPDVKFAGWLSQQDMAVLVCGEKFPHSATTIPLRDVPFMVVTWREWLAMEGDSLVYLGDPLNNSAAVQ